MLAFGFQVALQKRVASVVQNQACFARWTGELPIPRRVLLSASSLHTQLCRDAVVVFGEAGFSELELKFGQCLGGCENCVRLLADEAGHLEQNAVNLG